MYDIQEACLAEWDLKPLGATTQQEAHHFEFIVPILVQWYSSSVAWCWILVILIET